MPTILQAHCQSPTPVPVLSMSKQPNRTTKAFFKKLAKPNQIRIDFEKHPTLLKK